MFLSAFDEIVAKKRQEKDGTLSEVEKKKKQEVAFLNPFLSKFNSLF